MKKIIMMFMALFVFSVLLFNSGSVMDARAETDSDFNTTANVGNVAPELVNISYDNEVVTLTAGGNTTVDYQIHYQDENGYDDINMSATDFGVTTSFNGSEDYYVLRGSFNNVENSSIISQDCALDEEASSGVDGYINCSINFPYYTRPATLEEEIYSIFFITEDNSGEQSTTVSGYYHEVSDLAYVNFGGDSVNWGSLTPEQRTESDDEITLDNYGNVNFNNYDLTGYNLSDGGSLIDIDTFGLAYGQEWEDEINFTDGTVHVNSTWAGSNIMGDLSDGLLQPASYQTLNDGNEYTPTGYKPLKFIANVPSGTPTGEYTSEQSWNVAISE